MKQSELLLWLNEKLEAAEKNLKAREQSDVSWRGGTEKEWAASARMAGMKPMGKKQRAEVADTQNRIAVKCRREVEMFKSVIIAARLGQNENLPSSTVSG